MRCVAWANICLVLLVSSGASADRPVTSAVAPVPVDKVVEVFQTNEVRAEKLYADKEIEVTGRVARVIGARSGSPNQGDEDRYVVEFQIKPLDLSRIVVHCYFSRAERESLADLKPGQEVVIRGTCTGLSIYTGDYRNGGKDYVELHFRKCKLVAPK